MLDATRISAGATVTQGGVTSSAAARTVVPPAATQAPADARLTLNPRVFFDSEIDQLVMEFRDSDGAIRSSLPSAKELAAYRWAARTGAAEPDAADPASPTTSA